MKNRLQEDLYDYCRWNQEDEVSRLLRNNPKILDVTEDEGLLFYLGIKHKNVSMLSSLLRYFENFQLNLEAKGSYRYLELKNKLHDILSTAIEDENITPSEEMKRALFPYVKFEEDDVSRKSDFVENDTHNHSGESTQVTLEDEHSLLSESVLSQYTTEHARDIKDLPVYQAIKALQAVYSKSNDELAINIARDFGVHAGDGNSSHVRVWHKGIQKVIDIYSSISAEVKGVHLSLNSIIKDIITSPDAINCNLDGHEQHVNLSGCEYEYQGDDI